MARAPRIYLDACTLNRLTDPPQQPRIALESAAVQHLLHLVQANRLVWVASAVLLVELSRNPDILRRGSSLALLQLSAEIRRPSAASAVRGRELHALGYGQVDALHLAMAEESSCEALLTTDDRFLRRAQRGLGNPAVVVENPLNYLQEVAS